MAFRDLREFIQLLEQRGELIRVKAQVDPELEITEITDRISKGPAAQNKAMLFENVKGSTMPVLINAFGSASRMALGVGRGRSGRTQSQSRQNDRSQTAAGLERGAQSRARSVRGAASRSGWGRRSSSSAPVQEVVLTGDQIVALEVAHPQMLAARRRQVHHVDAGHHARSGHEHAQRRHVSPASERRSHVDDALAAAQGRRGTRARGAGRARSRSSRARSSSAAIRRRCGAPPRRCRPTSTNICWRVICAASRSSS